MPEVYSTNEGRLAIVEHAYSTLPVGWSVVFQSGETDVCRAFVKSHWCVKYLQSGRGILPVIANHLPEGVVCPCSPAVPILARLLIFPHAGGGPSAYFPFARILAQSGIETLIVAYPGREARFRSASAPDMEALLIDIESNLGEILAESPCSYYGHSMGAMVAFELSRRRRRQARTQPEHLFLTGRQAPAVCGGDMVTDGLSNADFIQAVARRYHSIPEEILSSPETMQLILPSLRSDFHLVVNHRFGQESPLHIPTTLLNGTNDAAISPAGVDAWTQELPVVQNLWLDGDHFFLNRNLVVVADIVAQELCWQQPAGAMACRSGQGQKT